MSTPAQILWMPTRPTMPRSMTRRRPAPQALPSPSAAAGLSVVQARYICDPRHHSVYRVDAAGHILGTFGDYGRAPGQFDTPSDSTVVLPMFEGEDIAGCSQAALVAVADRMNHRVQVFELEGQFVTAIGEFSEAAAQRPGRDGWPYFRLTPHPVLPEPVRLRWEAPWLHVVDARGETTRVDLAYAMLPVFDTWLAAATPQTLISAHHHFRFCVPHTEAMALPLMQLETALGDAWLRAGDIEAVTRVWSLSWPAGLPADVAAHEAAWREQLATTAAFRLGSAQRVARLRMALRLIAPAPLPVPPPASAAADLPVPSAPAAARAAEHVGVSDERKCVGE